MNRYFNDAVDDFMEVSQNGKIGFDLIVPLMVVSELRQINDNLGWLSQEARWREHGG